jgi:hypothetical protein
LIPPWSRFPGYRFLRRLAGAGSAEHLAIGLRDHRRVPARCGAGSGAPILYGAWIYAIHSDLLKPDAAPEVQALVKRRNLVAQTLYAIGAALVVFGTGVSIAFIVLVQLNFAIAQRIPWLSRI